MSDNNPVKEEVQKFDKKCLKKTNTAEKNTLPTQAGKFGSLALMIHCSRSQLTLAQSCCADLTQQSKHYKNIHIEEF